MAADLRREAFLQRLHTVQDVTLGFTEDGMSKVFSREGRRHHRKLKKRAKKLGMPVADLHNQEYWEA